MNEIFRLWQELIEAHPEYRVGQALFNAISTHDVELAERLRKTEKFDPFYDDTRVGVAIGWLYAKEEAR